MIVAGPNGSGKTSLFQTTIIEDFGRAVWIINPDVLAARIQDIERVSGKAANLQAVKRIESWLKISIASHQTIGVETVLSTAKYRKLVRAAKKLKFKIALFYVILSSPGLHVARVRLRVEKGGHHVVKSKILARRARSLSQLPWFLREADEAWMYDNSGENPRLIGRKKEGTVFLDPDALPEIREAVRKAVKPR